MKVVEGFLSLEESESMAATIEDYRRTYEVPLICRAEHGRSLRYQVINGEEIHSRLGAIQSLYENLLPVVRGAMGTDLVPLRNRKVGLNINITPPGGEYRWHYDRNAVTGVLYLNTVDGGNIEAYPNYRLLLTGSKTSKMQGYVDGVLRTGVIRAAFGQKRSIAPAPGLLVIMRGDKCLHSVSRVTGTRDRICVVMSFDSPDATFPQEAGLDEYLYSAQANVANGDPNYSDNRRK